MRDSLYIYLLAPELSGAVSFHSAKIRTLAHSLKSRAVGVSGVNLRLSPDVCHCRFRILRRVCAEPEEGFSD